MRGNGRGNFLGKKERDVARNFLGKKFPAPLKNLYEIKALYHLLPKDTFLTILRDVAV